jgi:primosomal protein N' (replication factor Y)
VVNKSVSYVDVALPLAVRQVFTYRVPGDMDMLHPGMRVWVPFRSHHTIGMVVRVHQEKPEFKTKPVSKRLDDEPLLAPNLLALTQWLHRFYYCSWGESIQAALPMGLNFNAVKYWRLSDEGRLRIREQAALLTKPQREVLQVLDENEKYAIKEANKRWKEESFQEALQKLQKAGLIESWEEPEMDLKPRTEKVWRWSTSTDAIKDQLAKFEEEGKTYKWIQAIEELLDHGLPALDVELREFDWGTRYTLDRIEKEGLIESHQEEVQHVLPEMEYQPDAIRTLNQEQQYAFEQIMGAIEQESHDRFLLHGVTGSGKTEVYIHALKEVLERGKGGLILVPEIALTPQTVKRFYQIFGNQIAVLHSRLTQRERYDAWWALRKGEKKIAIGARSAIFAPIQDLGLIVVDEEHDSSYKQIDPAPRYHGRDVALMRGHQENAVVVLGSATPSMNSYQAAKTGKHKLLELKERHADAKLPPVKILDLKQYKPSMRGPLAGPLFEAMQQALERDEQIILLHNRRGFSNFLQCEVCGTIPECPHCSVSLTYHKKNQSLRCHYCGYARPIRRGCPECQNYALEPLGTGTQQVEEQLIELFPEANILRMDQDTTRKRNAHEVLLSSFDRREADILIGTQLVAKGLNFPHVTVVGVIDADTELAFPSFQSAERMYQLLSQVSGRSGRDQKPGKVFIQTRNADHPAIQFAKQHDYVGFARHELQQRKMLNYPPYARLIKFTCKGRDANKVQAVAVQLSSDLQNIIGFDSVTGPAPAAIERMKKDYSWELHFRVTRYSGATAIESTLNKLFTAFEANRPQGTSGVRITVNVDAIE